MPVDNLDLLERAANRAVTVVVILRRGHVSKRFSQVCVMYTRTVVHL